MLVFLQKISLSNENAYTHYPYKRLCATERSGHTIDLGENFFDTKFVRLSLSFKSKSNPSYSRYYADTYKGHLLSTPFLI